MLLGLDIGSSSIKAAVLRGDRVMGRIVRQPYKTHFDGPRVEVEPAEILNAIRQAIRKLGAPARRAEAIGLSVMAPAWVVMDHNGKAITPIVTHQDRRSVAEALELENRIGKTRHLTLSGVRPVPGGISSTTWAWFLKHQRSILKRADLVGHLNTFLIRAWTGNRVIDPSNASFMGVYSTMKQSGWNDQLCRNARIPAHLLPEILESNQIAGRLTPEAARSLGLIDGTPVFAGMIDTSAAMLLSGAKPGQLLNTCGSTDVLAPLTDHPKPHERLITRAFGIGRKWMSVSTIAAAGSAMVWAHDQLFADYSWPQFSRLVALLAKSNDKSPVRFEPGLAGDRMSIEQPSAAFTGLKLSTTRQEMLHAMIDSLADASAARLPLLSAGASRISRRVMLTGRGFEGILHRDWPGRWRFHYEPEATLRGLGRLIE